MEFLRRLFGRTAAPDEPAAEQPAAPPTLRTIIEQVVKRPSLETRRALYRRLPDEQLVVAVAELLPGVDTFPITLDADTPIRLLTSEGPHGSLVVLAFTDEAALQSRVGDTARLTLPARDVLELTVRSDYTGIVLNPADTWVLVPRVDVERMLAGAYA